MNKKLTKLELAVYTISAERLLDHPVSVKDKEVRELVKNSKLYLQDRFRKATLEYTFYSAMKKGR